MRTVITQESKFQIGPFTRECLRNPAMNALYPCYTLTGSANETHHLDLLPCPKIEKILALENCNNKTIFESGCCQIFHFSTSLLSVPFSSSLQRSSLLEHDSSLFLINTMTPPFLSPRLLVFPTVVWRKNSQIQSLFQLCHVLSQLFVQSLLPSCFPHESAAAFHLKPALAVFLLT